MGRPRKIRSRAELEEKWKEYKKHCDSQTVTVSRISRKTERVIRRTLNKRLSYTIEGFCCWLGLSRSAFYETYERKYPDIVTRVREECEVDCRRKFETGELPSYLAGLWMSKYGYGLKEKQEQTEGPGVIVLTAPAPIEPPPEEETAGGNADAQGSGERSP